jgi:gas vesicle protein GvpA/GvpJ/GvpM family
VNDLEPWDAAAETEAPYQAIALVDLLDRVLAGGVAVAGEVTLAINGIDLTHISLRAVIASIGALGPNPDE